MFGFQEAVVLLRRANETMYLAYRQLEVDKGSINRGGELGALNFET